MGCVLIEAKYLGKLRGDAEDLVLTGGRVHFHNESAGRRREILTQFAEYPMSAFADGITWAVGAGAAWHQLIDPSCGT